MDIKTIINFTIFYMIRIFAMIIFLIGILLILYYITPNNYQLQKFTSDFNTNSNSNTNSNENSDSPTNNFILIKTIELEILGNSQIKFEHSNYYLKVNKEISLIVTNLLKSQKIILGPNQLIKINSNSQMIILNETDKNETIIVEYFQHL